MLAQLLSFESALLLFCLCGGKMWLNEPISKHEPIDLSTGNYNLLISVEKSKPPGTLANSSNDDLGMENRVYTALKANSKTSHLTDIKVYAKKGVVTLLGLAANEDEIVQVYDLVKELDGINIFKMNFKLKR